MKTATPNSLCKMCLAFQKWPASMAEKWFQSAKFPHWSTGTLLEASVAEGCHLCKLMQQALLKSERPEGETKLPDRQIFLSLAPADFAGRSLRIDVVVEPESLETAGRPKFDGSLRPGFMIIPEGVKDRVRATSRISRGMGVELFWIADCKEGYEYFRGDKEISSAEFWAIVNPCYHSEIELYPIPSQIFSPPFMEDYHANTF